MRIWRILPGDTRAARCLPARLRRSLREVREPQGIVVAPPLLPLVLPIAGGAFRYPVAARCRRLWADVEPSHSRNAQDAGASPLPAGCGRGRLPGNDPIERSARAAGHTKYNPIKLLMLAFDGIPAFSIVPLRAAAIVGSGAIGLSFLLLSSWLYAKYWRHSPQAYRDDFGNYLPIRA